MKFPILNPLLDFSQRMDLKSKCRRLASERIRSIHSMVFNLRKIGVQVEEAKDGYAFDEIKEVHSAVIESFHRS